MNCKTFYKLDYILQKLNTEAKLVEKLKQYFKFNSQLISFLNFK